MSRTNKDKPDKVRFAKNFKQPHDRELSKKEEDTTWHWLQATPSWWNNLFHTVPRRRAAHDWERKVALTEPRALIEEDIEEEKNLETNKPHKYYW